MATDEDLVGQLANGDEDALRELLRRYDRAVSSFLYRHTGGRDVEDLFQETWLRVARQAGRFDRSKRFSTWLFQIAINLCRDWYRRNAATPRSSLDEAAVPAALGLERTEAALDAATLLATLPEAQREVVILRFFHDQTEDQVAELVGCPKGTVKSRLHHALASMAKLVKAGDR